MRRNKMEVNGFHWREKKEKKKQTGLSHDHIIEDLFRNL